MLNLNDLNKQVVDEFYQSRKYEGADIFPWGGYHGLSSENVPGLLGKKVSFHGVAIPEIGIIGTLKIDNKGLVICDGNKEFFEKILGLPVVEEPDIITYQPNPQNLQTVDWEDLAKY